MTRLARIAALAATLCCLLALGATLAAGATTRGSGFRRCAGSYNFGSSSTELPPVYTHGEGGFFREIVERGTSCRTADRVVVAFVTYTLERRPRNESHIPAAGFRCRVINTSQSDEQNIHCSASHGRQVHFHQGS